MARCPLSARRFQLRTPADPDKNKAIGHRSMESVWYSVHTSASWIFPQVIVTECEKKRLVPHILSKRHRSVTLFKYSGPQTSLKKWQQRSSTRSFTHALRQSLFLPWFSFGKGSVLLNDETSSGLSREQSITHLRLILHFTLQTFLDLLLFF